MTIFARKRDRSCFRARSRRPILRDAWRAVELLESSEDLVRRLWDNAAYFKGEMKKLGFDTGRSETPIVPVMLGDAGLAKQFSRELFEAGVFAMSIGFPTVPRGGADPGDEHGRAQPQ